MPEVVVDGESGYLFSVGDIAGMSDCAVEILSDDELRRKLGRRGREVAVERFDERKIVPMYRAFYERVIG